MLLLFKSYPSSVMLFQSLLTSFNAHCAGNNDIKRKEFGIAMHVDQMESSHFGTDEALGAGLYVTFILT